MSGMVQWLWVRATYISIQGLIRLLPLLTNVMVIHVQSQYITWCCTVNIRTCVTHDFCDNVHMLVCNFTQRANIKCWKSATEILQILQQAYSNEAVSRTRCSEWHLHFIWGGKSQADRFILTHNVLLMHFKDLHHRFLALFQISLLFRHRIWSLRSIVKSQGRMCRLSQKYMSTQVPVLTAQCHGAYWLVKVSMLSSISNRNSLWTFWLHLIDAKHSTPWNVLRFNIPSFSRGSAATNTPALCKKSAYGWWVATRNVITTR